MNIKVKKLNAKGIIPTKGTPYSAGLDLYSPESTIIEPRSYKRIATYIGIEIPKGCYGRIAPRSSIGAKGIDVFAGVVDNDYGIDGQVQVILYNSTNIPFKIEEKTRIAQIIIEKYEHVECILEVDSEYSSEKTLRNGKGFGSTGI